MQRFLLLLSVFFLFTVFSLSVLAHAGSHDNQNCFINVGGYQLNLNGYQFQGEYPNHIYCRIFPELGEVVIKVESTGDRLRERGVYLELLKLQSWTDWLFHNPDAFSVIKKTPPQNFDNGVVMIQSEIQERGIYALHLELRITEKDSFSKTYLFVAGIPVTKMLVIFSGFILLLIAAIFSKQMISRN